MIKQVMLPRTYRWLATLCGLAFVLIFTPAKAAETVVLAWDPNPEPNVTGYLLYYGGQSTVYTNQVAVVEGTRAAVGGLNRGETYYFSVSAFIADSSKTDESALSSEVVYTIPLTGTGVAPIPPIAKVQKAGKSTLLWITGDPGTVFHVESSTNLVDWTDLGTFQLTSGSRPIVIPNRGDREYFRTSVGNRPVPVATTSPLEEPGNP